MKIIASWLSVMASVFVLAATAFGTGDEGRIPPLNGAVTWLNTAPLNSKSLRGKVVLVNFWTYSCINSLRELPYLKAWAANYKDAGLVVIGVHTPEFGFEKDPANVKAAVADLGIEFPRSGRQRSFHLVGLPQRILACELLYRRKGASSLSPLRRR
jgi:thiol-disulfide isomerase/thioredoxin